MLLCFLCAVSSSIDSLSVSISYSIKGVRVPIKTIMLVSFISTLGTYLSMKFVQIIIQTTGENIIEYIGSFVLIFMGAYFIYDTKSFDEISVKELINNPSIIDYDNSGVIDLNEAFFLATALTVNNIGVGIASSIAGLSIGYTTLFTFIVTILSLEIGDIIGRKFLSNNFGKYAQVISGAIIMIIGLVKIL